MNNSYITIIKEERTDLSRKRVPLNQNECTANFRTSVPFEQNLQFISRPALNHYLITLEKELGFPLFKRIQKKMIPTEAGAVYIQSAREMLEIKKQAYKIINEINHFRNVVENLSSRLEY